MICFDVHNVSQSRNNKFLTTISNIKQWFFFSFFPISTSFAISLWSIILCNAIYTLFVQEYVLHKESISCHCCVVKSLAMFSNLDFMQCISFQMIKATFLPLVHTKLAKIGISIRKKMPKTTADERNCIFSKFYIYVF